jgi:hypothetical protein
LIHFTAREYSNRAEERQRPSNATGRSGERSPQRDPRYRRPADIEDAGWVPEICFFINDNLAWSHGAHELRFGTNTRIFRLNDYDFGQGTVPTVIYTTLPQFIYGVSSTANKAFPTTANEPFNFLNLDLYAQDTWRVTPKLTWTIGVRDTFNSNPLNPHQQIGRLRGAFNSISHDVNQPLNAAIQTNLGHLFSSTPIAILPPRTAIAWQFEPNTVFRTGFGIFSDIMPGSIADLIGPIHLT